ncbi:MAG: CPBP family intramembrane glutamic endopeptidase [Pyrodictiaceae archaeon]
MYQPILLLCYAVILLTVLVVASSIGTLVVLKLKEYSIMKAAALSALLAHLVLTPATLYTILSCRLGNYYTLRLTPYTLLAVAASAILSYYINTRKFVRKYRTPITYTPPWLTVLVALAAAPFNEETIFRLLLLLGLVAYMGIPVAVATTAIVFAALHYQSTPPKALPGIIVLAIIFSIPPILEKNIASSIISHAIANAVGLAIAFRKERYGERAISHHMD